MNNEETINDMIGDLGKPMPAEADPVSSEKPDVKSGNETGSDSEPATGKEGKLSEGDGTTATGEGEPAKAEGDGKETKPQDYESMFKKQQAEWTKEHDKTLQLEQEMAELKQQVAAQAPPPPAAEVDTSWLDNFESEANDDAVPAMKAAFKKQQEMMQAQINALSQQHSESLQKAADNRLAAEEAIVREKNPDYDAVINDIVIPHFKDNPALHTKWINEGANARAAYELGQKVKSSKEILEDPEAFKERIRKEIQDETAADTGKPNNNGSSTLAKMNSESSSPPDGVKKPKFSDPIDGVLLDIENENTERNKHALSM